MACQAGLRIRAWGGGGVQGARAFLLEVEVAPYFGFASFTVGSLSSQALDNVYINKLHVPNWLWPTRSSQMNPTHAPPKNNDDDCIFEAVAPPGPS